MSESQPVTHSANGPVDYLPPAVPESHEDTASHEGRVASEDAVSTSAPGSVVPRSARLRISSRTAATCLLIGIALGVQASAGFVLEPGIWLLTGTFNARSCSWTLVLSTVVVQGILAVGAGSSYASGRRRTAAVLDAIWALSAAGLVMLSTVRSYGYFYSYLSKKVTIVRDTNPHLAVLYGILTVGAGVMWYAAGQILSCHLSARGREDR